MNVKDQKPAPAAAPLVDKSTCKLTRAIDWKKEIVVTRIFADGNLIAQHRDRLTKGIKNITPQTIDFEIAQVVIKDNLFSAVMNEIVPHFTFQLDTAYLEFVKQNLKRNLVVGANAPEAEQMVAQIADKIVKKGAVFKYLTALWKVKVTDEEVKEMLDVYYQRTNEPIRDVLEDKNKFEGIRAAIHEEKLIMRTIGSFPIRFLLNQTPASSTPPPATPNKTPAAPPRGPAHS